MHSPKFVLSISHRYQGIEVQSKQFSFNFSVPSFSVLRQKINFWKVGLNLLEKQLTYNPDELCFHNNSAQKHIKSYEYAVTF